MAESVDINLINNESYTDFWSLGCDIIIEEADTDIQEIRLRDIGLIGDVYTGEVAVDINPELANVMDLDVNVTVDGVNPSIVESQIVTYDNILKITDLSKETTNETRYAASARSAKEIYDLIQEVDKRVDKIESSSPGTGGGTGEGSGEAGLDEEQLQKYLDDNQYITEQDLEEKGYATKEYVDELDIRNMFFWADEAHTTIGTEHDFFSKKSVAAKGLSAEGEIPPGAFDEELLQNYLDEHKYVTEEDIVGLVPDVDFSAYATKEELSDLDTKLGKEIQDLQGKIVDFGDWFYKTDDGQTIVTKYNLVSEKSVAAKGLASESSGEEGEGGTTTGEYKMYKHVQSIPSAEWRILHGLGKYPNVKIVDTMKQLCFGDIIYESEDVVVVKFGAAESGVAYLD